jgi:hypothetical protein
MDSAKLLSLANESGSISLGGQTAGHLQKQTPACSAPSMKLIQLTHKNAFTKWNPHALPGHLQSRELVLVDLFRFSVLCDFVVPLRPKGGVYTELFLSHACSLHISKLLPFTLDD